VTKYEWKFHFHWIDWFLLPWQATTFLLLLTSSSPSLELYRDYPIYTPKKRRKTVGHEEIVCIFSQCTCYYWRWTCHSYLHHSALPQSPSHGLHDSPPSLIFLCETCNFFVERLSNNVLNLSLGLYVWSGRMKCLKGVIDLGVYLYWYICTCGAYLYWYKCTWSIFILIYMYVLSTWRFVTRMWPILWCRHVQVCFYSKTL